MQRQDDEGAGRGRLGPSIGTFGFDVMRGWLRYVLALAASWFVVIAVRAVVFDRPPTVELLVVAVGTVAVAIVFRAVPLHRRV